METRYLDLENGKIAFEDAGQGPLVICAPSMGDLRAEYRFLAPPLIAAGYRVVTMDVRGHGQSSPRWSDYSVAGVGQDYLALAGSLQAGPAVLIGASMAAGAAVWAAAEAPDQVRGIVLVDPFVRGGGDWMGKSLAAVFSIRPWGPAIWRRYYASLYPTRKPADFEAYTAALQANLAEPGRAEALGQMLRASKAASAERLSKVSVPALVLMGSKDPDFKDPAAEAQWVAAAIHGECQMIPGAGHYPHAELPELTVPRVLAFLQGLQSK